MVRETIRQALDSLHDDLDTPIDAITGLVESAGWAASERRPVEAIYDAGDMIGLAEDRIDRIDENPGAAGLTNRLIEEMGEGLGGVEKGTYNIIAGRPGMGKTSRSEEHTSALQSLMRRSYA